MIDLTMIEKMSQETLRNIIEDLIARDAINLFELEASLANNPSNEIKRDVDLLHTLMCALDHQSKACQYYVEEQAADCWTLPCHRHWMLMTTSHRVKYQIDDMKRLAKACRDTEMVLANLPSGYAELTRMIIARNLYKGEQLILDLNPKIVDSACS